MYLGHDSLHAIDTSFYGKRPIWNIVRALDEDTRVSLDNSSAPLTGSM